MQAAIDADADFSVASPPSHWMVVDGLYLYLFLARWPGVKLALCGSGVLIPFSGVMNNVIILPMAATRLA
jgi:hypothetical protein